MKILKVIHGYPPLYNAGSEVYSQTLCLGMVDRGHEVHVFTREENPFAKDYEVRNAFDCLDQRIKLHIANIPGEKHRYRYSHKELDRIFSQLLKELTPDVVHIGHLNHLSTTLVHKIKDVGIPIVYTLHDYWLMCPRGQFIQRNSSNPLWALCDGQKNQKCAEKCYSGYFSGCSQQKETDTAYWTDWVGRRMDLMRDVAGQIDHFIAPAKYLYDRFVSQFALSENKLTFLDYGFDHERLKHRKREPEEDFTFGYIGTHIPAKGIQLLVRAFAHLDRGRLRIWGKPRDQNTGALKAIISDLPPSVAKRIEWIAEYRNEEIVSEVFNRVDAIVTPSIWVENSPLVIHEALQARVPVITADAGGMAEHVKHEINGLQFKHRCEKSLAEQMHRFVNDPTEAKRLGQRGYLYAEDGNIPSIDSHAEAVEEIYQQVKRGKT